jgi:hypothetical protein
MVTSEHTLLNLGQYGCCTAANGNADSFYPCDNI